MVIFVIWLTKLYSGLLVNWDNQKGEVLVPSCAQLVENFPALSLKHFLTPEQWLYVTHCSRTPLAKGQMWPIPASPATLVGSFLSLFPCLH